ncbi:MAG: response regulator [Kofleriaceae bacterium]
MSKIVLCIDDSATMQQVADITFRGTEFTYVGARSYDDGLSKAKSQQPAVILADAQIAGKSGYDLCLALKSDGATANIPVVILVGNHAPYDNGKGILVGADANLPKPWDTQTMLEKVTEVVTKAGASGVAKAGHGNPATQTQQVPTTRPVPVAHTDKPATNASAASMPPRSATIMGMPTIKMPGGVAQPATPAPSRTTVMAVPPISNSGNMVGPATRSPAPPAPATPATPATPSASSAAAAAPAFASITTNRAPMISGTPTKRSALVERTLAKMAAQLAEASGLQPGSPELLALLKLSTEIVERVVWEVVPELAEQIIRENLHDLTARKTSS